MPRPREHRVAVRRLPNGRWQARWRDLHGKQRAKNFPRDARRDADRFAAEIHRELVEGSYVPIQGSRMRFSALAALMEPQVEPTTAEIEESCMRKNILPIFGDQRLGEIQTPEIMRWVADLSESLAPATVHRNFQLLNRVLAKAVRDGLIRSNPCEGVKLPKIRRDEQRYLRPEEIETLASGVDHRYRAMIVVAAYSGARWGELAALSHENVEPLRRIIRIERGLRWVPTKGTDGGSSRQAVLGPTKTKHGRRTIKLPGVVMDELSSHMEAFDDGSSLIFSAPLGTSLRRHNFRQRVWLPAVKDSGLAPLRFHDLRHTYAAMMITAGVQPYELQRLMGHGSIRTTYDIYGHLYEGFADDAVDALDAMARAAADARRT